MGDISQSKSNVTALLWMSRQINCLKISSIFPGYFSTHREAMLYKDHIDDRRFRREFISAMSA